MTMTTKTNPAWRILYDNAHYWKAHFVPASLLPQLTAELADRAIKQGPLHFDGETVEGPQLEIRDVEDNQGFFYDEPGMVYAHRRIREVRLDGFPVAVPSEDWDTMLSTVKLAPLRHFADGSPYYKLHAWRIWCMVMTPEQRNALIAGMEAQLADAEREGREDHEALVSGINGANEKLGRKAIISKRVEAQAAPADQKAKAN
jgi:hypothetical protein